MAYQVGGMCFASLGDSAAAACSNFTPITGISGASVVHTTCNASNSTGQIQTKTNLIPVSGGTATSTLVWVTPVYPNCIYPEYSAAILTIIGALITGWASFYFARQLYMFLHWSRGDKE